jgi:hypothetical protein
VKDDWGEVIMMAPSAGTTKALVSSIVQACTNIFEWIMYIKVLSQPYRWKGSSEFIESEMKSMVFSLLSTTSAKAGTTSAKAGKREIVLNSDIFL